MVVNGIDSNRSVLGTELPLDGCFAAQFTVTTATFAHPIVVLWRAQVGASTTFPAAFDLANPPPGWTVLVYVDCEPVQWNLYFGYPTINDPKITCPVGSLKASTGEPAGTDPIYVAWERPDPPAFYKRAYERAILALEKIPKQRTAG